MSNLLRFTFALLLGFTAYDVTSTLKLWNIPRALVSEERFGITPAEQNKLDLGFRLTVAQSRDGMYFLDGEIHDVAVEFLVDTGATFTVINREVAEAAGIAAMFSTVVMIEVATGEVGMQYGTIPVLRIGNIELTNVEAMISPNPDARNLLGMSFLGRMKKVEMTAGMIFLHG